ncbi:MAG: formate hydrogenlyase, partial [Thiomonas sp.]
MPAMIIATAPAVSASASALVSALPLSTQLIHLIAALLLLLSFAMLAQRRVVNLVNLFAAQGALLVASTVVVAYSTGDFDLYQSAALTLLLKVIVLPFVLHKLIRRLHAEWDIETLVNIPTLQ